MSAPLGFQGFVMARYVNSSWHPLASFDEQNWLSRLLIINTCFDHRRCMVHAEFLYTKQQLYIYNVKKGTVICVML